MASPSPLSKANTIFCLDLFKKLSDNVKTKNIFYSPFSISSALAMVMLGTRGNTATQISEVLSLTDAEGKDPTQIPLQMQGQLQELKPPSGQDVHAKFAKLLNDLNKEDALYDLSIANRLYGEQSYQFVQNYLADTLKYYGAELESVDFKTSAELARVRINTWVVEKTQRRIKDLLAQGVVDDSTRLVLVNAIYFKGLWDKQFKEDITVKAKFRINKKDKKQVMMMSQSSRFPLSYISEEKCQILEMPYKGQDLSMLIFLPDDIEDDTTGLEKLEEKLNYENFLRWTRPDKMYHTLVDVTLPRFKMAETYGLNDVLKSMGMTDAFNESKSDFSGMSPVNNLVLKNVFHKSFVEVNEEGTEAAAATAGLVFPTSVSIPARFRADHPFLFFIRHNTTLSILFAGRYCSPE